MGAPRVHHQPREAGLAPVLCVLNCQAESVVALAYIIFALLRLLLKHGAAEDAVFVAGTLLLTVSIVPITAISLEVILIHLGGALWVDGLLVVLASALLFAGALLTAEQYLGVVKLSLLRNYESSGGCACGRSKMNRLAQWLVAGDAERLERRLEFLLERFDVPRVRHWHFVMLGR